MFKKFTTKQLILIALIGAIVFAFDLIFISGIDTIIGIPGSGILIDTIFVVAIAVIAGLVIRKFGVYTMTATIYTLLAIPTNIVGPPGIYKIGIGFLLGLFADVIILLFKYKKKGYYWCLPIANALVFPVLLYSMIILGIPGTDQLLKYVWLFLGITFIEGLIGSWIGIKLYEKKINKMRIIKQISS